MLIVVGVWSLELMCHFYQLALWFRCRRLIHVSANRSSIWKWIESELCAINDRYKSLHTIYLIIFMCVQCAQQQTANSVNNTQTTFSVQRSQMKWQTNGKRWKEIITTIFQPISRLNFKAFQTFSLPQFLFVFLREEFYF